MANFEIHRQLLLDCHRLGRFQLCHALLHKNASLPWFILVPETDAVDFLDLPEKVRNVALTEASAISTFIKTELDYPKVYFASIGNVVPQLHLHIVGRRQNDPCWPAPVWGHLVQFEKYSRARISELSRSLAERFALKFSAATS